MLTTSIDQQDQLSCPSSVIVGPTQLERSPAETNHPLNCPAKLHQAVLRQLINNMTDVHVCCRWIMYVEKSLCDKDNKLMIHQATLRKLKRRLAVLQQMADAPLIYARSVVEVVRRKTYSQHFLQVRTPTNCYVIL